MRTFNAYDSTTHDDGIIDVKVSILEDENADVTVVFDSGRIGVLFFPDMNSDELGNLPSDETEEVRRVASEYLDELENA